MTRAVPSKLVLLFHMAYQMATLVTMPPFLRLLVRTESKSPDATHSMSLVLRSIGNAASSMVRLVHVYRRHWTFRHANPLLIHHILSASIVNVMNTTTMSPSLRRHSVRSVCKFLDLLEELKQIWPVRCAKSIAVINSLAIRWDVESIIKPDAKKSWEEDNAWNAVLNDDELPSISPLRVPDADAISEYDLEPGIDLDVGQEYNFLVGQDPIMPEGNLDMFEHLPQMGDFDDLSWVCQEQHYEI